MEERKMGKGRRRKGRWGKETMETAFHISLLTSHVSQQKKSPENRGLYFLL
jgi:hypothetical protein